MTDNHKPFQEPGSSSHADPNLMTIEGVVKRSPLGIGTWSIVGSGRTVEIFRGQPKDILQEGLKVRVTGKIRTDVMTAAMIGPVFDIQEFHILE